MRQELSPKGVTSQPGLQLWLRRRRTQPPTLGHAVWARPGTEGRRFRAKGEVSDSSAESGECSDKNLGGGVSSAQKELRKEEPGGGVKQFLLLGWECVSRLGAESEAGSRIRGMQWLRASGHHQITLVPPSPTCLHAPPPQVLTERVRASRRPLIFNMLNMLLPTHLLLGLSHFLFLRIIP